MKWNRSERGMHWGWLNRYLIDLRKYDGEWRVKINHRQIGAFKARTIEQAKAEALRLIQDHLEGMVASVKKARGEHETPDKAIQARGMAQNKSVQSQDT